MDNDRLFIAIAIMRAFTSAGLMNSKLYNEEDPFCENREPDGQKYALDMFYARLLKVKDGMHTKTAKGIAIKRSKILYEFLNCFKEELYEL